MMRLSSIVTRLSMLLAASIAAGIASCGNGTANGGKASNMPASGEYLWEMGSDFSISYAAIDTNTGKLSAPTVAGTPANSSANLPAIAIPPSNKYLYVLYAGMSQLETFEMTGPAIQLRLITEPGFSMQIPLEEAIVMHPSGKFLYVIASGHQNVIQEVTLNPSTGSITPGNPVLETANFGMGVIDPSGQFLFVNDVAVSGRIFAYQINQVSGDLSPVPNSPFSLPANQQPTYLAIGGTGGSFLYASLFSSSFGATAGVAAFSIDHSTGALRLLNGSPFQSANFNPIYISSDPSGRFLYCTHFQNGSIFGFAIDPTTGALSPLPGSPFRSSSASDEMTVDLSGKFLYVTDCRNSTLQGFAIDAATGALTPLAGSPFPAVAQPAILQMMRIP